MNIAIIGSGNMGQGIGTILAHEGHTVRFSFSRDSAKLDTIAAAAGPTASATSPAEAVLHSDVVVLAVWFAQLDDALQAAGDLSGKTVISCVSGLAPDFSGQTIGLHTELTQSVAEIIASRLPAAHVVEAFNTTFAETLAAPTRDFQGHAPACFTAATMSMPKQPPLGSSSIAAMNPLTPAL